MDSHITDHLPIIDHDVPISTVRLPGEPGPAPSVSDAVPPLPDVSAAPRPRRRGRAVLLGGVGVLIMGAGSLAFLVSPYNTVMPVPGLTAQVRQIADTAGFQLPVLIAPSATLARVPVASDAPPPVRDGYVPQRRSDSLREIVALHPNGTSTNQGGAAGQATAPAGPATNPAASVPAQKSPVSAAQAPASSTPPAAASVRAETPGPGWPAGLVVAEPGAQAVAGPRSSTVAATVPPAVAPGAESPSPQAMTPVNGQDDTTPLPAIAASAVAGPAAVPPAAVPLPQPAASSSAASSGAASRAPDPVVVGENLRAGPMTPPEQIQVLDLVTQLSKIVHDLKAQDNQLRADLRRATAEYSSRLDDYARRLALAEAKSSLARASRDDGLSANDGPVTAPLPGLAIPIAARTAPVSVTAPAGQLAPTPGALKRYRVQAASPGLALLSEVDRGGGEGAQTQIMVGDTLPDYGKVKSIAQRGTAWVVTAERGTIQ